MQAAGAACAVEANSQELHTMELSAQVVLMRRVDRIECEKDYLYTEFGGSTEKCQSLNKCLNV